MFQKFKCALLQTQVSLVKDQTLKFVCEAVEKAVALGGQFCILGETFNSLYQKNFLVENAEDFSALKDVKNRQTFDLMHKLAKENKIYLLGSLPEKEYSSNILYNTALCFNPNGEVIAKYRKSHLFDIDIPGKITYKESDTFAPGNKVQVFQTEFGNIGIGICYDVRFPEFAQMMRLKGAQMLIYPGAFNQTTGPLHYELLHRARAVDNQLFVAGVSTARYKEDSLLYQAWGHSLLVNPIGQVLISGGEDPYVAVSEVDFNKCDEVRKNIPTFTQRRNDYYELLIKQ